MEPRPTFAELLPLAEAYYAATPENGAGGSLHIVLDDGNIDDEHVRFCIAWAEEHGDIAGVELAHLLLRASRRTRERLYHTL